MRLAPLLYKEYTQAQREFIERQAQLPVPGIWYGWKKTKTLHVFEDYTSYHCRSLCGQFYWDPVLLADKENPDFRKCRVCDGHLYRRKHPNEKPKSTRKPTRKRNNEIFLEFMDTDIRQVDLGKKYGITGGRIGQIIRRICGLYLYGGFDYVDRWVANDFEVKK